MDRKQIYEFRLRSFIDNFNFAILCYDESNDKISYTSQFRLLQRKTGMVFKGLTQSKIMVTLLNHASRYNKIDKQFPFRYKETNTDRCDKSEELRKDTVGKLLKIILEN